MNNNKFIALIMSDDSLNFAEEFKKFSEEEQEEFVNFFDEVLLFVLKQGFKDSSTEDKVKMLLDGFSMLPKESLKAFSEIIMTAEFDK